MGLATTRMQAQPRSGVSPRAGGLGSVRMNRRCKFNTVSLPRNTHKTGFCTDGLMRTS